MKAAVLAKYGKIEWRDYPEPELESDDILIKVTYASICGSDQHIFRGDFHPRTRLPFVPGHEFCGKVAGLGNEVSGYKLGDRVIRPSKVVVGNGEAGEEKAVEQ